VPLGEKDGSLGAIKRPGRRGSQHKGRSTLTDSEGLMHAKCPRFYFNAQHICGHFFLLIESCKCFLAFVRKGEKEHKDMLDFNIFFLKKGGILNYLCSVGEEGARLVKKCGQISSRNL
jgi:hypothetical protein